jgi:predicted ATPase/DNA-binding winged helix-turn-helix (wHTH) protein
VAGQPEDPVTIAFGRFTVVCHRRELLAEGRPVELGGRALDTLLALLDARGTILSKDALMSRVWPDRVVEENNLAAQISGLRKVLGADRHLIRTVAGRGYQFTGEIRLTAAPAAGPAPPRTTNLPEALSELIGREAELGDVTALATEHRLVSLVGAGGIGKTRLGLEVARHLLPRFPDGVFVAELGPVSSPELVPATVASALGLTHGAGTVSPESVAAAVGTKQLLLVIDNCEHVIEAVAAMAEALLRASPGVSLLATSREPLRVSGEYVYRVPPLDVPAEDNQDTEDIFRHGAVRLFVSRAHAAEPRYVAEGRVAAATAAICRRLDGIPLAIELAATRIVAFGVDGVAARLDDRFRLLTGGRRTLPRHQTIRATLDWSYELLSESDRVVLRRLAIFAGGFTLDAAAAVATADSLGEPEVLDGVGNLVAKSLVSADLDGTSTRYRLLETTRAYGLAKLAESGELDQVARRHAGYYRDLLERAERESEARPPAEWRKLYARHLDNARAALDWAFSPTGDAAIGIALTVAAVPLWMHLSLMGECCARVERVIATLGPPVPPDARRDMKAFLALGTALLHTRRLGSPEMTAALTKALELAESLGDTEYRLRALFELYVCRIVTSDYPGALALAEKFVAAAAGAADPTDALIGGRLIGLVLHVLGDQRGASRHVEPLARVDLAAARPSHIVRYQFDQRVVTESLRARILWLQGFPDRAVRAADSIVDYARAQDHPASLFYGLMQAACPVALYAGDLATADRFVKLVAEISVKQAMDAWNTWARCFEGVRLIKGGESATGSRLLRAALEELPEAAFHMHYASLLAELAQGLGAAGQIGEGLGVVDKALARAEQTEEGWCLAELLRTKGELHLLERLPTSVETAEKCFHRALDVARDQGALSWELRSAMSLARLWHRQQRVSHARKLLAPVYRRFTEGFGTADLIAAKVLLASVR